jgi:hypothetical protein
MLNEGLWIDSIVYPCVKSHWTTPLKGLSNQFEPGFKWYG